MEMLTACAIRRILLAAIGLSQVALGRAQQLPSVEELLPRIQAYAQHYREAVPSFEAKESADSQLLKKDRVKWEVRFEATLRELRDPANSGQFVDSYMSILVDGKAPPNGKFKIPYFVQGAFTNVIGFGSPETDYCFDFRVSPGPTDGTVQFELWVKPGPRLPGCASVPEEYRKTVVVDPATGTIEHEVRSMSERAAHKLRDVPYAVIDYSPQDLGGQTFWLPVRFEARDESKDRRMTATYSDFHRYTSTSTIVSSEPLPDTKR